jgi:arylsulfatase A-like enzyme
VILFTTDHGEMMGDHGLVQKSCPFASATTVPTAIRHPDHLDGQRVGTPVELTDLTATMLDVAGLDAQQALAKQWPAFHGVIPARSLLPLVRGDAERIRDYAFSECSGDYSLVQSDRWKYVCSHRNVDPDQPEEWFYDLEADPCETVNRIADRALAEEIAWHRRRLWHVHTHTPPAQTGWAPVGGRL